VKGAGEKDALFDAVLRKAREESTATGAGAELYERRGTSVEIVEDDEGRRVLESRERGFALRLYRGGRVGFAASGAESAETLVDLARLLLPRARSRRGARPAGAEGGEEGGASTATAAPLDEAAAEEVLTAFRRTLTAAGEGAVTLRDVALAVGSRDERLETTAGRAASWSATGASLVATVLGRSKEGRFSARVVAAAARPEELPLARLARHAVDRVLLPITGRPAPAGKRDLLLDSHVSAHLVARLAPLFLGDTENALLASRTRGGKDPLASAVLTLVDDVAAPGGPVRTPRDGEGTVKKRVAVVEHGRPAARLTDLPTSARLGIAATGNAFRRSFAEPPEIGLTNFFVDPSAGVSPLDLLADVKDGIYLAVLLERPEVDLAGDRFRLSAAGYAIERGRAAARISEAVVFGRLSELLRGVTAIGDDLKFVTAGGGGAGAPTLLVPRWKF